MRADGLMSLFEVEHRVTVDYQKWIYDVYLAVVMALHSIIKSELDTAYPQWLKATRQLGANMGTDSREVAALFAFLEVVLPPETYMTENIAAYGPRWYLQWAWKSE
ncbi:hypothetical protein BU25DRAFT_452998 [Macroventuria anomochaeta]|uniref:Uncharacterized protein n=1 Tax=Macroventuria anomochaeta TaxID=301207 RepID=A0ACB6SIQ0_9PLEO|nr:uncharacterized protein BU25DRAFT_452998 [Macroventuria anomochaeta]KAF2633194.1 hypothetical protein BU25DRAFT_452998 [Macroventuria anomochaeta]